MDETLKKAFPRLTCSNFTETSPPDRSYLCISWAAGKGGPEHRISWWPSQKPAVGCRWPDDVPLDKTTKSFVLAFKTICYKLCDDGTPQEGYEKVALYAIDDVPTHMARQLPDGQWTSKLGKLIDITHASPDVLEGPKYGSVCRYFRREFTS